ncbi:DUF732 domain-containing protein [Nocardia ignorata]|uniref:Uncharacterized protein DUF732 n=1 Tax=Nocardia ignorata TaxID=145285 RepID=A0A4R6P0W5_NOCIG|nr:DUF732 domain-containing protein [Nocardia ignorata]TDP30806.1 uncharacterized protein DUF732 [Nocardia ignorata]
MVYMIHYYFTEEHPMRIARIFSTMLAVGATAAALSATAPAAIAAPSTGSAGGSSSSDCGGRSAADRVFLRESDFDEKSCSVQDSAIRLALSECRWLDTHGGSASNQIELAESTRDTLDYPYTFLDAAITAYCPHHSL